MEEKGSGINRWGSLDHLDGLVRVGESLGVELEVAHPLLPVVIEEEVAAAGPGSGLLPTQPLFGTDGLFDVPLEGLVREGFIRWNLLGQPEMEE